MLEIIGEVSFMLNGDGATTGFAIVEYATKEIAKQALAKLNNYSILARSSPLQCTLMSDFDNIKDGIKDTPDNCPEVVAPPKIEQVLHAMCTSILITILILFFEIIYELNHVCDDLTPCYPF